MGRELTDLMLLMYKELGEECFGRARRMHGRMSRNGSMHPKDEKSRGSMHMVIW